MTDQTGPARQGPTERCTCGHTKRDHSGRRDHHEKYGPTVAGRPWCHACETECIYCPPDPGEDAEGEPEPELTFEEARALADDLGLQLYRAQDALAFIAECCDIADREQRTITAADVREWLKGARCGRQLAADATTGSYTGRAEQAEAAINRVRAVVHVADDEDVTDWQRGFRACSVAALRALNEAAPAATEATGHPYLSTGCLHGHHDYCQAMTGHAGAKRPGQCKFCAAPCLCSCHQSATGEQRPA